MVTIRGQAALSTLMPALAEAFRRVRSASAYLARAGRVDLNQLATSVHSFVLQLCEKGTPSGVVNTLSEHRARQALDVQIFDGDCAVVVDQPTRNLVVEVGTLIFYVRVYVLQKLKRFAPAVRTLLSSRNLTLCAAKFRLRLAVVARVFYFRAVRKCGES